MEPSAGAPEEQAPTRVRFASILGVGLGALAYFLTLLHYSFDLLRGATAIRYAEQFFELQADALRAGRLWVPSNSLGIEGFVVDDRTYSYFGIFPALLRIPVQLVTHEYDGRLTLVSMAIGWIVYAAMTTRLFWLIRSRMGRPVNPNRTEVVLAILFLAASTGGTVLTFDAALPWVYHEVYVWSVASVMGALYWLLRVLSAPDRTSIGWLFGFAMIASMTRTPGGWAVCLATIAAALWLASGRLRPRDSRLWLRVLAAGIVPLLVGIMINYLKFRHPYMFPLQNQVWTQLNAHRREVLADNGGTLAGLQFFPSALVNYFRLDGIRFVDYFPWVTLPAEAADGYGAVLDQSSRTGSVPSFMPLLFVLALASIPVLFRRGAPEGLRTIRLIWFGALLMTGAVMAYGYIAYRYTSEFVPGLVVGAAVTTVALGGWLSSRSRGRSVVVVGAFAGLTVFSLTAQMVVGYTIAATTYKGPALESYLSHQVAISGSRATFKNLVTQSGGLPLGGSADDLWIRGDCDALYFNTGEAADPWFLVQERDTAVVVRIGSAVAPGLYPLLRDTEESQNTVGLRVTGDRQAQLVIDSVDEGVKRGQLFDLPPDALIRVGARILPEYGFAQISSTPGGDVGFLPTARWDANQKPAFSSIEHAPATEETPGLSVRLAPTLPLPLCQRIADSADVPISAAN